MAHLKCFKIIFKLLTDLYTTYNDIINMLLLFKQFYRQKINTYVVSVSQIIMYYVLHYV